MGVFVVAGLAVLVSLTMGQGEAKPKGALALIFGIIGAYLVLLFLFQLRGVERKGTKSGDWLLDLWLAERLADALGR